ncbi:MAG: hypothetical protein ABIP20_01970 [Chthoniobacteraceae bacterium]
MAAPADAANEWQLPEAGLRYKLDLIGKPTHTSAGYYTHLPDGGILRGVTPATVVMTEDGKVIPSFLLWHNAESGFSMVFGDAGDAKTVNVYVTTTRQAQLWRPNTGITPSAILCTNPGHDTMAAAKALGSFGRVDSSVHSYNKAGIPRAPLSIGGDDTGRPKPAVFYHLAHVDAAVTGKYWIAPFIRHGAAEVLIDGAKLTTREQSKSWGGDGASVDLQKGIHRVEVFQTAPGTGAYDYTPKNGGLSFLTWRGPNEKLKGAESRVFENKEIVRSGACKLTGIEAKDGSPVAFAQTRAGLIYWFGVEEPLIIYTLDAVTGGNPADTTYTWTFPEGGTVEGASTQWLLPGFRESHVKLTAKSGKFISQYTVPVFGFSTEPTTLEKIAHREAFRVVLAKMLAAYPRTPDPVAGWSDAYWNNLLRTVEQGEGYPVLRLLFSDRWETVRKKLGTTQATALQDVLVDIAQRDNPKEAVQWLEKFFAAATDATRKNELRLRNAEVLMYYLGDKKAALTLLTGLAGVGGDVGDRAKIRLGDLAFIEGDLNKATSYYADLQNAARARRNATGAIPANPITSHLLSGGTTAPDPKAKPTPAPAPPAAAKPGLLGRGGALQDVSLSENVRSLVNGGYLIDAHQALLAWEREFPLSKISGDYILRESSFFISSGDFKRARPMLEAYCREIDASSFLPQAASMLINCVKLTKEPRDSIREVIEKVSARLKYHPVAKELDAFLAGK